MGEIVLVRHGQANMEATDEASYDRLSDLGRRQSAWLGEWLTAHEAPFDRIVTGTLTRHRQTAEAAGLDGPADARWNEMDYFTLGQALMEQKGVPLPEEGGFEAHVAQVLVAWQAAEIAGQESFEAFEARLVAALADAAREGERVLCITSGGAIAMVLRHVLGLDLARMAQVATPIWNTSLHRLRVEGSAVGLSAFNAIPHLDDPDRASARTH